ncbi:MAG: hypothetical protein N2203_00470 [Bacteroidia bacterium]|nr:hypothetical protein [Bacteroidia bacterium]
MRFTLLSLLKNKFLVFLSLVFVLSVLTGLKQQNENYTHQLNKYITAQIDSCFLYLDSIAKTCNFTKLKFFYLNSRKHFKKSEWFIEFFYPRISKYFINSPLVAKSDLEINFKTIYPHGFQVIESIIFNAPEFQHCDSLKEEVKLLKHYLSYMKTSLIIKRYTLNDVIDMLRFEIIRIMSLYLNGYDATISKTSIQETIYIFESMNCILEKIFPRQKIIDIEKHIKKNIKYLLSVNDSTIKRLPYFKNTLIPLYNALYNLYDPSNIQLQTLYSVNIRAKKFSISNFFNSNAFRIYLKDSSNWQIQRQIGEHLFFDPALSANKQRSCASCHKPELFYSSENRYDKTLDGKRLLKRNTPSLLNVMFQRNFFWDGRALQLDHQIFDVISNHEELGGNFDSICIYLRNNEHYRKLFKIAFHHTADTAITPFSIVKCLSEYLFTINDFSTKFDLYFDKNIPLTDDEINGYDVYAGKGLCGSCHFFPLFNGLFPPFYGEHEYEVIGTPIESNTKQLSPDSGRYYVSKNIIHIGAFKTPTLRNSANRKFFMHNGVFNNLNDLIVFYKKGGGAGLGIHVPNQTLPFDSLSINEKEISDLIAFLKTLNSTNNFIKNNNSKY